MRNTSTGAYRVVDQTGVSGPVNVTGDGFSACYLAVAAIDDPASPYAFPYMLLNWNSINSSSLLSLGASPPSEAGSRSVLISVLDSALAGYAGLAGTSVATPAKDDGSSALVSFSQWSGFYRNADAVGGVRVLSMGAGDSIVQPTFGVDVAVDGGDGLDTLMFATRRYDSTISADYLKGRIPSWDVANQGFEGRAFLENVYDFSTYPSYSSGHWFFEPVSGRNKIKYAVYITEDMFFTARLSRIDGLDNSELLFQHGGIYAVGSVQFADINGDGYRDMILQGADNRFWVAESNGSVFRDSHFVAAHGGDFNPDKITYADVDGDRRVDLIYQGDDNRFWVGYSNGVDFGDAQLAAVHTADRFGQGRAHFADFDADGRTDLMYQGAHDSYTLYAANGSTGNGSMGIDAGRAFLNMPFQATEGEVAFADISGDGRPDLIRINAKHELWLSVTGSDTFI